ncbi:MAG: nitroreductase family deazaflavin-dependent oxidoreductase [Actinomycetia bacterium]|nr:nitroreductase family deazaflavin-dependent oxidoreductase [Actinomycetes bacterium]
MVRIGRSKDGSDGLMPSWLPAVNKRVFNRIQGLWAPYVPPYAVILHKGRKSGNVYRTPVTAFRSGSTLAVPLPYGSGSDWVRNVLAAGFAGIERGGRFHRIANPRIVEAATAEDLPAVARAAGRFMRILVVDLV